MIKIGELGEEEGGVIDVRGKTNFPHSKKKVFPFSYLASLCVSAIV